MLNLLLENFKYVILFFGILTGIILYLIYRKNISAVYNSKVLFSLIFLFFLYRIPQGFDLTDEGFVLTKSRFMFHGAFHLNIDMIWGSSFVNGLWLSILNVPSLIWERVGFTILVALNSLVVFKILKLFFTKKESFLVVLFLTLFIPFGVGQTINYQNLPVLFILISFWFFLSGIKTENRFKLIFSGFVIVTSAMLRFPLIVYLSFPVFYAFSEYLILKKRLSEVFKNLFFTGIGIFGGLFFFFLVLHFTNSFEEYINAVIGRFKNAETVDSTHTLSHLINVYLYDLRLIFQRIVAAFVSILIFAGINVLLKRKALKILSSFILGFLLFVFALKVPVYFNWIYTVLGFELAAFIIFLFSTYDNFKKYFPISFFALFLFFTAFVGSDIGFRMHLWSGAEIFFGSVFLLLLHSVVIKFKIVKLDFRTIIFSFIVFLILLYIKIEPSYIYRDQPRRHLTENFEFAALKGIKSTKRRVETTDSLLFFVSSEIKNNETVFVAGTMPMLYFLMQKKPVLKDLWKQDSRDFEKYIKNNLLPNYFIFPLKNPRNYYWPERTSRIPERDSINLVYYKNFVYENNYETIFKNSMFEIYKQENK